MKPFGELISYQEAKDVILQHMAPLTRIETVSLDDAAGRVLASDFKATMDIPGFHRAAMDGYAVKSKDTFGAGQFQPRVLKIAGAVHAGERAAGKIKTGECMQISTGAMMPGGADAVMMVEDTERDGDLVKMHKAVVPGANVGKQGEDIQKGSVVLTDGIFLDPGKIGVLASHGLTEIRVYEKPRVAILPTGEEVVPPGSELQPGQLYDINSHTISGLVKENGGVPVFIGISGDTKSSLKRAITRALQYDIVVLSGGSSVGERDLLVDVIHGWGEVLFHGVQVKPGKPTIFAVINQKPVMGMPGYPTSCLINSYLFLLPALRRMARLPLRAGAIVEASLSRRIPGSTGRRQFLTVKLVDGEAVPVFKESGAITSIAHADGYIEIPENIDLLEKGHPVTVVLF